MKSRSKGDGHLPFDKERKREEEEKRRRNDGLNDEQSQAVDLAGLELSDSFTFQPHSHTGRMIRSVDGDFCYLKLFRFV